MRFLAHKSRLNTVETGEQRSQEVRQASTRWRTSTRSGSNEKEASQRRLLQLEADQVKVKA